ncbi:MAG: succinate dehydrogenase, hydrophobic membrane anchor protein [Alphaproteobacteria bacterium]|nr:succinate dehydrogenase, hydrophobic membrane anchor protein [Alphaproteobacteria bacterium]
MSNGNKTSDFETKLKKAKGLGSAHHGAEHWMAQKITALANIPLVLWMVWSFINNQGMSYVEFRFWLADPFNAVMMILAVISVFYHAVLGSQVIVEDYIHIRWFRNLKLIGQKLFFFALGAACIFSVLKIAL